MHDERDCVEVKARRERDGDEMRQKDVRVLRTAKEAKGGIWKEENQEVERGKNQLRLNGPISISPKDLRIPSQAPLRSPS